MSSSGLYQALSEHLTPRKREIFERIASMRTRHLVMVMEDIYQTQNASAILRSMESWGVQDVYTIENSHSLQMHHRIAKGAQDWLTMHRYNQSENNTVSCMLDLKKKGYRIAATVLDHESIQMSELDVHYPTALVMGTELTGVSHEVLEYADVKVMIPMCGFTESLNVSVAAAVLMQDFTTRLRLSDVSWQISEDEQTQLKIEWARKSIYWSQYIVDMYESGELTTN